MHDPRPLRVAQITDLHLCRSADARLYGSRPLASLERVLAAVCALPDPPTHLVATGDLSEDGSEASYRQLRRLLLETGLPVLVLPGNHDAPGPMADVLIGGPIEAGPIVRWGGWQVVALDSTVPGEPHGFLAAPQLARLRDALGATPRRPTLVCTHHSPAARCPFPGCRLHEADALWAILESHENARALISGHAHVALETHRAHLACFITPSTCAQGVHPGPDEAIDPGDFWAAHRFDPSRLGFRTLALHPDGRLDSEVHWVSPAPDAGAEPDAP